MQFFGEFDFSGQNVCLTYLGGPGHDEMHSNIDVYNGEIFFTGHTGAGYPVTAGAFQSTMAGGSYDAFIGKITCSIGSGGANGFVSTTFPDSTICTGDSIMLQAYGATSYVWTPNTGISDDTLANPMVSPAASVTYTVVGTSACGVDSSIVAVNVSNCPNAGCVGNLIANGGFENYSILPSLSGQYDLVDDWSNCGGPPAGTPDYYHVNGTGDAFIPANPIMGTCVPNTGDAIMGAVVYGFFPDFREYIDVQLSSPLTIGQTYDVSFYVTSGDPGASELGCDNIGVHFSVGPLIQAAYAVLNVAPDYNHTSVFYNTAWQQITFQYTPVAAVDHITVGNFFDDASTTTAVFVAGGTPQSYVFYDDFCVTGASSSLIVSANTSICQGDSTTLLASNGVSYTWVDTSDFSTILHSDSSFTVGPNTTTTYAVFDANDTAYVEVTVTIPPDAGLDGTVQLCTSNGNINLVDSLGGSADVPGTWVPGLTSGTGDFDPLQDPPGTYQYVVFGTGGCPNDTSLVVVAINQGSNAGTGGTIEICSTETLFNLFDSLSGNPESIGAWSPALAGGSLGIFDPATNASGDYVYTVQGIANCPGAASTITVNVSNPPNAGTGGSLALCSNDKQEDLTSSISGNPDSGGSWLPLLTSGSGVFNPAVDLSDVYTYTVNGGVCGNATASVTVTVSPSPVAGLTIANDECEYGIGSVLVTTSSGTAPFTYVWNSEEADNPLTGLSAGVYTVVINDANGCVITYDTTLVNLFDDCGYHVYVPNIFTPNGDEQNDVLYVRGVGVKEFTMIIYNRWGNKVFETSDMAIGWDGVYNNQDQSSAVFVYYLTGTFIDGDPFKRNGNVSVVK
jgi:gliding motility-associated-like protein